MTKMICDICGKEIVNMNNRYSVNIDSDVISVPYILTAEDVCKDCANSIYHYIKGLSKEDKE